MWCYLAFLLIINLPHQFLYTTTIHTKESSTRTKIYLVDLLQQKAKGIIIYKHITIKQSLPESQMLIDKRSFCPLDLPRIGDE
jgi:hypothetical protein